MVEEADVVETASEAAEDEVFEHYARSDVTDFDVTVTFEDGILEVDVYLDAPEDVADPDAVAEGAVRAAETAVDELLADVDVVEEFGLDPES